MLQEFTGYTDGRFHVYFGVVAEFVGIIILYIIVGSSTNWSSVFTPSFRGDSIFDTIRLLNHRIGEVTKVKTVNEL